MPNFHTKLCMVCGFFNLNRTNPMPVKIHPPGFAWFRCIQYCARIAQRIEHVNPVYQIHQTPRMLWLLLLDSGLCIAKPRMLCICHCTNSIKVQQLGDCFVNVDWFWWIPGGVQPKRLRGLGLIRVNTWENIMILSPGPAMSKDSWSLAMLKVRYQESLRFWYDQIDTHL